MRKRELREIAVQRIEKLMSSAVNYARKDLEIAKRHAEIARKIALRLNIRLPYKYKVHFCHGCKSFIVPGINCRVRIRGKVLRLTCLECGHVYRRILRAK
jgi:ribonuclease P protein subunit RPR2